MPQTYKIDQAATFAGVALLSVEPKVAFGSTEQDRTSDGVPKWEAQLVAGFHQFGKINNEILKVGVMEKKGRDGHVVGVQVWYRAEQLRPISSTAPRKHQLDGS